MRRWFGAASLAVVLAGFGVLGGPAPPACACTCAGWPDQAVQEGEWVRAATAVFVGVAGRPSAAGAGGVDVPFAVDAVAKGTVGGTVTVHSMTGMCGYEFTEGVRYRVYAHRNDGRLVTSLCSGNRPQPDAFSPAPVTAPPPAAVPPATGSPLAAPETGRGAAAWWLVVAGYGSVVLIGAAALLFWLWTRRARRG